MYSNGTKVLGFDTEFVDDNCERSKGCSIHETQQFLIESSTSLGIMQYRKRAALRFDVLAMKYDWVVLVSSKMAGLEFVEAGSELAMTQLKVERASE